MANPDALTSSSNCLSNSGCARMGSLVTRALRSSKAFWWSAVHCYAWSFFVRALRGCAMEENPLINAQ